MLLGAMVDRRNVSFLLHHTKSNLEHDDVSQYDNRTPPLRSPRCSRANSVELVRKSGYNMFVFVIVVRSTRAVKMPDLTDLELRARVLAGRRHSPACPSNVIRIVTQWNRLCKNGYACRSPDRRNNGSKKQTIGIEIENRASCRCDRTGFWKSGFNFCLVLLVIAPPPLLSTCH